MPHILIEYSEPMDAITNLCTVSLDLIEVISRIRIFTKEKIKIYFLPIKAFLIPRGGLDVDFIHVTVKMFSGRKPQIKKKISYSIMNFFEQFTRNHPNNICLSVDIYEINKKYYKIKIISRANSN